MRGGVAAALALGVFAALVWALLDLPGAPSGLTAEALAALDRSGVRNPVTAVLLNYRGYDTLLEVAVLLLAVVGVWSVDRAWSGGTVRAGRPLLLSLLRLTLPLTVLAGGYLLWIGAFAPGGAFQGGALVAGGLVLARLGGLWRPTSDGFWLRAGLAVGASVFVLVAAIVQATTGGLLRYPQASAGGLILAIETAALVSIALTLGAMYLGGRPSSEVGDGGVGDGGVRGIG